MKYKLNKVNYKSDSENYTFSKKKGLQLFELIIFPYCGLHDATDDDMLAELQEITFFASSEKTALSELTKNIVSYHKSGLDYSSSEQAQESGFSDEKLQKLLSFFDIDVNNIYQKMPMAEFLDYNEHCKYVLRKLNEKVTELFEHGFSVKGESLVFVDDDFNTYVLK